MKLLTNEERYLIERGLELLSDELHKEASIYESQHIARLIQSFQSQ